MGIENRPSRAGLLYGLAAYGLWGVIPFYIRAAANGVPSVEFLAHRIVWSFLLLAVILMAARRWPDFQQALRSRKTLGLLTLSACCIAANWLLYIHGVSTKQVVQTSLGYFINPLFSVLLGLCFFGERLRPGQWIAVLLATIGIVYLVVKVNEFPWIALGLALSFGFYGLIRKVTPVDGLIGLAVETLLLAPIAMGYLVLGMSRGTLAFGQELGTREVLIALSGFVTTIPLLCFGQAARLLPLSTLGFLQYLAPTLQFLIAVIAFEEPFTPQQQISFGLVWTALVIFTLESALTRRRLRADT